MVAVFANNNFGLTGGPLQGDLRFNEPLAGYTSWRVGGPADRLYLPLDSSDLVSFLRSLPDDEPVTWLGLGSNVLIRDGGIRGTVVCTKNRLKSIRDAGDGKVYVEAGVPCPLVAKFCAEHRLTGVEFLAGIPGTFGGALAMNAGAFGGETWPLVFSAVTVNRKGVVTRRSPEDFVIGYRSVDRPADEWFLAAELILQPGEPEQGRETMKLLLAARAAKQPIQQPSCGSVFRNPPGDFAARLIECCGLKGYSIGGAQVSEKHANFIVNTGGATAADIESLIEYVRDQVGMLQGIDLVPECHVLGAAL
jgi:UDP-N-acetylmuramate dehydrogenase